MCIRDRPRRSEQLLVRNLKDYPDHAQTNNALGYSWANQGKNLGRAEEMLKKALEKDPKNYAYLDSLAWVYYKLGRFKEAKANLEKSIKLGGASPQPVILDHYADTLWRMGEKEKAYEQWLKAGQAIQRMRQRADFDISEDPELRTMIAPLGAKIQAYSNKQEPLVAPLAPLD